MNRQFVVYQNKPTRLYYQLMKFQKMYNNLGKLNRSNNKINRSGHS